MAESSNRLRIEHLKKMIHVIRGQRVMLDTDLANLYGVTAKALNSVAQAKCRPLPGRPRVSTDGTRGCRLEVTNCEFK